jgi:hypothetical protein
MAFRAPHSFDLKAYLEEKISLFNADWAFGLITLD